MVRGAAIEVVDRFAKALDGEDYALARSLLSDECVYLLRGERIDGADDVIASYQGNGNEANQRFDSIDYGSSVRGGDDGWVVIEFWDEITHRGRSHRHRCEQWVIVESGMIVRIEHRDLQGEVQALHDFKAWCAEAD